MHAGPEEEVVVVDVVVEVFLVFVVFFVVQVVSLVFLLVVCGFRLPSRARIGAGVMAGACGCAMTMLNSAVIAMKDVKRCIAGVCCLGELKFESKRLTIAERGILSK